MKVGSAFAAAVLLGGVIGTAMPSLRSVSTDKVYSQATTNCHVIDGDTLRCDGGRVRLLGIDAPELPGHCAHGRTCVPGDPFDATRSLDDGMGDGGRLPIQVVGTDRYGRTLALVKARHGDLSCWQLTQHQAIYKPQWDNGGRVRDLCPTVTQ